MVNLNELVNKKKSMNKVSSTTITDISGKRYQIDLNDSDSKPTEIKLTNGYIIDTTPDQISHKIIIPDEIFSNNNDIDKSIRNYNLYIGSQDCAINKEDLISKNITSILNVGFGIRNLFEKVNNNNIDNNTDSNNNREDQEFVIEYFNSEILDDVNFNIIDHFNKCFKFIDDKMKNGSGGLLCHCNAGISRSCTIIIAYLMNKGISLNLALEIVKSSRPQCKPNQGFMKQLENFETLLKNNNNNNNNNNK